MEGCGLFHQGPRNDEGLFGLPFGRPLSGCKYYYFIFYVVCRCCNIFHWNYCMLAYQRNKMLSMLSGAGAEVQVLRRRKTICLFAIHLVDKKNLTRPTGNPFFFSKNIQYHPCQPTVFNPGGNFVCQGAPQWNF